MNQTWFKISLIAQCKKITFLTTVESGIAKVNLSLSQFHNKALMYSGFNVKLQRNLDIKKQIS